jgi:DNA-binding beta-propeller fold protein YncE
MSSGLIRFGLVPEARGRGGRGALVVLAIAAALTVAPAAARADGSVYVANSSDNNVSQYNVGAGGVLSPKAAPTVSSPGTPFGIAVSPDARSVYVTDLGTSTGSVSQYDVGVDGALSPKTPASVPAGAHPLGVAVSPNGSSVYVADANDNNLSQYDVGAGGALSPKAAGPVFAGTTPEAVAASPDGKSVYVADFGSNKVYEFDVGAGGALVPKSSATVSAGTNPVGIVVSPDGMSVYVTNEGGNVSQYDVGAGEELSLKTPATVNAGTAPTGIAISSDGKSLYVANDGGNVSQYDVGAGGVLSPKTPAMVTESGNPFAVAVSPDGRSVYVTNHVGDTVSQYDVGAGGILSPKTPTSVATGILPYGIAILPDQAPVASFSAGPAPAGSATRFDGSSSSDSDGTIARYDWDFGDGSTLPNGGTTPSHTYAAAGTYTVTLTVTDNAGCSMALVFTGQTASCVGSSAARTTRIVTVPTPTSPVSRLTMTALGISPSALVPDLGPGPSASVARKRGALVTFKLSSAATVAFAIERKVPGRTVGGRCARPTRANRKRRTCTRLLVIGSFTRAGVAGSNRFHFTGRANRRRLALGNYLLIAVAIDSSGKRSEPVSHPFRIIR